MHLNTINLINYNSTNLNQENMWITHCDPREPHKLSVSLLCYLATALLAILTWFYLNKNIGE